MPGSSGAFHLDNPNAELTIWGVRPLKRKPPSGPEAAEYDGQLLGGGDFKKLF